MCASHKPVIWKEWHLSCAIVSDAANSTTELPHLPKPEGAYLPLLIAVGATLPAIFIRVTDTHLSNHIVAAALFGLAIVGSAFLMSWAAEVAELDISRGLAIAVLALIAVLPEYAVDLVFATKGGEAYAQYGPTCLPPGSTAASPCGLALANMTGGNRMLIGIGWSLVVFVAFAAWRKHKNKGDGKVDAKEEKFPGVTLPRSHSIEVAFLAVASLYSLTLPLRHAVGLFDAVILVGIFVVYTIRVSRAEAEEPELVGPAAWLGSFSVKKRRATVVAMLVFAAFVILLCAERFAESLVAVGRDANVSEFFLVQWVAPLATEAPELLVAALFAWRLRAENGLSTLVSSKVNQWTLLVGTLPIAFTIAAGKLHGLPIDSLQREELFLTAAQTLFAIAVLINLTLSFKEAWALLLLFLAQFVLAAAPALLGGIGISVNADHFEELERISVAIAYLIATVVILARNGGQLRQVLTDGLRRPLSELS